MKTNISRNFACKNEELPVVCGFGAISLARDLSDFAAYSTVFDENYLTAFKVKIEAVQQLIQPFLETVELKTITASIYQSLDDLIAPINHLEGYLKLAGKQVPVSSSDFGLVLLRKSARSRDVEGVIKQLQTVNGHIEKYKKELTYKGLTEELIGIFTGLGKQLADEKDKKYALVSNRAAIVQNNMGMLNDLSDQLAEICRVGKVLYKQKDQAKLKDYTFTQMMKQVKRSDKTGTIIPPEKLVQNV